MATEIDGARVTFDDIIALTDKELGVVIRACEPSTLALALQGLDEATCDRLLGAMSKRASQTLRGRDAGPGAVPRSDIEGAQAVLVATARRLAEDRAIRIGGLSDDD